MAYDSFHTYKQAKRLFSKQLRRDSENYEREQFHKLATGMELDSRRFWRYIHRNRHQPDNYHVINDGENMYVTPEEQASMWKNYFQGLLNEHSEHDNDWKREIDQRVQIITATSRLDRSPDDINMDPFTCEEIKDIVSKLPNGKAPGLDLINYEHIKCGGDRVILFLMRMFNAMIKHAK